jgi:phage shock protein C
MDKKRLFRSKDNRVFFGVCGGLGEYFDVDPTIIRIIFVILAVWGGIGVIAYIIGIFVIPENPKEKDGVKKESKVAEKIEQVASEVKENFKKESTILRADQIFGLIIVLIGLGFLFGNFFPFFNIWKMWPLLIIILGIIIIARNSGKGK